VPTATDFNGARFFEEQSHWDPIKKVRAEYRTVFIHVKRTLLAWGCRSRATAMSAVQRATRRDTSVLSTSSTRMFRVAPRPTTSRRCSHQQYPACHRTILSRSGVDKMTAANSTKRYNICTGMQDTENQCSGLSALISYCSIVGCLTISVLKIERQVYF